MFYYLTRSGRGKKKTGDRNGDGDRSEKKGGPGRGMSEADRRERRGGRVREEAKGGKDEGSRGTGDDDDAVSAAGGDNNNKNDGEKTTELR